MSSLIRKLLAGLSSVPDGPTIALLTDFGLRDSYVGVMKAVIAGINPQARVIDICHEVDPQDVRGGSFVLWSAHRYFPKGTIFVAVIDPGVGSDRDILIVETEDHTFLCPDNGLLDLVASEGGQKRVHRLGSCDAGGKWRRYALAEISATFHGRDIFAPLAAHLSLGVTPEQMGEARSPLSPSIGFCDPTPSGRKPQIVHIDRFGNVVTNVKVPRDRSGTVGLRFGRRRVSTWASTYTKAPPGKPTLVIGSSGLVEVIVRDGNAAKLLKVRTDTTISFL